MLLTNLKYKPRIDVNLILNIPFEIYLLNKKTK